MNRTLCIAAAFVLALSGPALAVPQLILRVPVEIDNLPAEVVRGQLECSGSRAATYDVTDRMTVQGVEQFAIEGGRYSGRVSVILTPGGGVPGADTTAEIRSYRCVLVLMYRCTLSGGVGTGWCNSDPGGRASASATPTAATMFAADPARPPAGIIFGTFDRSTATTLPVHR